MDEVKIGHRSRTSSTDSDGSRRGGLAKRARLCPPARECRIKDLRLAGDAEVLFVRRFRLWIRLVQRDPSRFQQRLEIRENLRPATGHSLDELRGIRLDGVRQRKF